MTEESEGLLPNPDEPEAFAFNVGDPVSKLGGYAFDGFIRSAFHNDGGFARYVVEHAAIKGMLHIFSRKQLAARTPSTGASAREILAGAYEDEGMYESLAIWREMGDSAFEVAALRAIENAMRSPATNDDWRLAARFWAKVDVGAPSECWPWRLSLSNDYPAIKVDGVTRRATQMAWEIANGVPFPEGMEALHSCDNPPCCNPGHIRPGTHKENQEEMAARGRSAFRSRPHCAKGHEYTPENTRHRMRDGSLRRICRTCIINYNKAARARAKATLDHIGHVDGMEG